MKRLKQRADFLAVAAGVRAPSATLIVQALRRDQDMTDPTQTATPSQIRVGFTVSKKVGNSVERNRVRRRLREVVRQSHHASFQAGHDYVLVGRRAALNAPFARIMEDVTRALYRVHTDGKTAKARANPQTGKRQTSR